MRRFSSPVGLRWLLPAGLVAALVTVPTAAQPCAVQPLLGNWRVLSMTMDGKPSSDPEMVGATLTFTETRLTIETRQHETAPFALEVDAAASPCAIHVTPLGRSEEPPGWMLYAIENGNLRLGFHDNLSRRAASFDARPKMVVLNLTRLAAAR